MVFTSCSNKNVNVAETVKETTINYNTIVYFSSDCITAEKHLTTSNLILTLNTSSIFNEPILKSHVCYKSHLLKEAQNIELKSFQINNGEFYFLPLDDVSERLFDNPNWVQTIENLNCTKDTNVMILNGLDDQLKLKYGDELIIKKYGIENIADLINVSFKYPNSLDIEKIWSLLYFIAYTETQDRIVFDFLNSIISKTSYHTISLKKYESNIGVPPLWVLDSIANMEGISVEKLLEKYE